MAIVVSFSLTNLLRRFISVPFRKSISNAPQKQKAVFITGCDSGLGYNFALNLHSKGVKVFAGVHNKGSKGAESLRCKDIVTLEVDVTDSEQVSSAVEEVERIVTQSHFDFCGIINNAGVMVIGEVEWQTSRMLEKQLYVNLLGPMLVAKAFLPLLRTHKGRIVNVTSHCSGVSLPGMSVYSATKAGLRAFTEGLRRELDKFGIQVIEFIPGSYVTDSCIMSRQRDWSAEMDASMSPRVRSVYGAYFKRYMDYLSQVPVPDRSNEPALISDALLFDKITSALLSPAPAWLYVNQPPRYAFYYTLFSLLPQSKLKDYFISKFIAMPSWEQN